MRTATSIAALLLFSTIAPALADGYVLGPQDRVRIKVIEWRAGKSEYQEWTALGADYAVNAAGRLSLPLVGEIAAEGNTTEQLAQTIAIELQKRAGLINRPDASVEVVQYRPIYLLGSVEKPGEYAYRPGLTVLQAIGVAGGFYRPNEGGLLRLERDRIAAGGNYEAARLELRRTIARRARFEAELADATAIAVPEELAKDDQAAGLLREESGIMAARYEALRSSLTAIAELRDLYSKEIAQLETKKTTQERQIALSKRELKNVSSLMEKGLTVSSREFTLERIVSELEGKLLDIESATTRARQELRKLERDAADLVKDRKAKTASDLRETRASIELLTAKLATNASLVTEASVVAPRLALERSSASLQTPAFSVTRRTGGKVVQTAVTETSVVEPGDVIRVEMGGVAPAAPGERAATDGAPFNTATINPEPVSRPQ
ncbi:polysaccharide biosynthesis/export family protein [Variibacter gotjawalensis]|uniref:polysaccharide biosynthesis/export family protein n=1 Tax=Variibacter gotjawalensis TaxID=1333996 RepID=UPI001A9391D3|nr:polysaccharide biosynthesis/export family protein [Variibacter gotjawalensis]